MNKSIITRTVGLDFDDDGNAVHFDVGDVMCLVECYDELDDTVTRTYYLTRNPRTNRGVEVWDGWLGTWNSSVQHAHGAYKVLSVIEEGCYDLSEIDTAFDVVLEPVDLSEVPS